MGGQLLSAPRHEVVLHHHAPLDRARHGLQGGLLGLRSHEVHPLRVQDWLILEASSVSYGKATSYRP